MCIVCSGGSSERRLLTYLFDKSGYNRLERPVVHESDFVNVSFGVVLQQIIDVVRLKQPLIYLLYFYLDLLEFFCFTRKCQSGAFYIPCTTTGLSPLPLGFDAASRTLSKSFFGYSMNWKKILFCYSEREESNGHDKLVAEYGLYFVISFQTCATVFATIA